MTTHVTFAVQESEKARMEASAAKRGQTLGEFVATSMIEALDMEVSIEALVAGAEEDFRRGDVFTHEEVLEHVRERRERLKALSA